MKKILALLLTIVCLMSFVACGSSTEADTSTAAVATDSDLSTPTPEPTPEPCEHVWIEATLAAPKTCEICGATEGTPLIPYFEEMGYETQTLQGHTATGLAYAIEDYSQYKETIFGISPSAVTRTPAEDEGYEIISFSITATATATYDAASNLNFTTVVFHNGLHDYYTGMSYGGKDMASDGAYDIGSDIEFGGVTYDVSYSKSNEWVWGDWQWLDDGNAQVGVTCTQVYTFKVPEGYDGIVYSTDVSEVQTEEELFGESESEGGDLVDGTSQYFRVIAD